MYPQQFLVGDLIDSLRAAGGEIRFGTPVETIRLGPPPAIMAADGTSVLCDFVLGCDGFHGVCRPAAVGTVCCGVDFEAEWLALLAEAAPSSEHQIYGLHPDGFAGHMHRTATTSRFYLQVEPGTRVEDWDDHAIWSALATRLAGDGDDLVRGPIVDRSILELRSCVTQPMQAGPLYLAGDAAHIVTPAGGKGMNLALQDVAELVEGLLGFYHRGDTKPPRRLQRHPPAPGVASGGVLTRDAPDAPGRSTGDRRGPVPRRPSRHQTRSPHGRWRLGPRLRRDLRRHRSMTAPTNTAAIASVVQELPVSWTMTPGL